MRSHPTSLTRQHQANPRAAIGRLTQKLSAVPHDQALGGIKSGIAQAIATAAPRVIAAMRPMRWGINE